MPPEVRSEGRCAAASTLAKHHKFPRGCVVRGYPTLSGWKDYKTGAVSGHNLKPGLVECGSSPRSHADTRPRPATTWPSTSPRRSASWAPRRRRACGFSLTLFARATEIAEARGILIADTKLEFGTDANGVITLGDEVLTPDSSRFWDARRYAPGRGQDSYDKQRIRDWLDQAGWDHTPPAPVLPPEVVAQTTATYREIHRRLTGRDPA
jgi:phosphoribosylaminoimidazole-succinocarboxamide synthase